MKFFYDIRFRETGFGVKKWILETVGRGHITQKRLEPLKNETYIPVHINSFFCAWDPTAQFHPINYLILCQSPLSPVPIKKNLKHPIHHHPRIYSSYLFIYIRIYIHIYYIYPPFHRFQNPRFHPKTSFPKTYIVKEFHTTIYSLLFSIHT